MSYAKKPYDKNKIGKWIGWGGEHLVFQYGDDRVIKFSLHIWWSGRSAVEKKINDYKIGQKYFGNYILPTEILTWKKEKKAVEIQTRIQCRFLNLTDFKDLLIKKQFDDIMKRHRKMETEIGVAMDLFGREGLFKPNPKNISNILVTSGNKLVLIDFTLLELKKLKIRELPIWLIIKWAKRRQGKLLNKLLN